MKEINNYVFEKMPVPKAIVKLALPTMLGMLVMIIYNLADTFFVGQLNDPNQVAAVTISMPVFMLLMSCGAIFGMGGGSYISRLLGTGDLEKVKKVSSVSFYMGIILSLICMIFGLIFLDDIIKMLGSSSHTYEFSKNYLTIILTGGPFILLSFSTGQIVRAEGAAKQAMTGMMIGTVINIILDPIFILQLKMGVQGAALATVIANGVSVIYYLVYFKRSNSVLSISPKYFSLSRTLLVPIFTIGIPAALTDILMTASSILLNNLASGYGDNVIAALGIASKATLFPIMLLIGLSQGVQPLIGYNYAAENKLRLNSIMKTTAITGTLAGLILSAVIFIFSNEIVSAFIQNSEVVSIGSIFLKINLLSVPFLGVMFLMTSGFQAMGKGIPSLILSVSRQGLVFVPVILIGNALIGVNGLVFAQPIADILSTFLAFGMFIYFGRELSCNKTGETEPACTKFTDDAPKKLDTACDKAI